MWLCLLVFVVVDIRVFPLWLIVGCACYLCVYVYVYVYVFFSPSQKSMGKVQTVCCLRFLQVGNVWVSYRGLEYIQSTSRHDVSEMTSLSMSHPGYFRLTYIQVTLA